MMSVDWETPQDFFDALDKEFGFDLDVCASNENHKCENFLSKKDDGLSVEWSGVCWMNPPYDKDMYLWMKKAYETSQNGNIVVCLVQGRSSDTKWFHDFVAKSSEIRYIKNRLHFGLNKNFRRASISSIVIVFMPFCKGPPKVSFIDVKGNKTIF